MAWIQHTFPPLNQNCKEEENVDNLPVFSIEDDQKRKTEEMGEAEKKRPVWLSDDQDVFITDKEIESSKREVQEEPVVVVNKKPQIYFCSRTHKQIQQVIDQLKKTEYRPTMAVLGSRNIYCINSEVKKSADKNAAWYTFM